MKIFLITLLFSSAFATDYLILGIYNNTAGSDLTESDIESINILFSEEFTQYGDIQNSTVSCSNDDCALSELSQTDNDYVVYTKLMKLGSKFIYTGYIVDDKSSFTSKVTALSIEDMENAIARLAKSLALNESIEDVVDIDNIIESEEEEDARRQSLGRVGFSVGYMFPTFNSYTDRDYDSYDWDSSTNSYSSSTTTTNDIQKIVLGFNYFYEFKENRALLAEFIWYTGAPFSFGADMSMLKYLGKGDFSPYIGGGLGIHWVNYCRGYNCQDELNMPINHRRSGINLNAQAGYVLFRTYNVNVIARAKYHLVLNSDLDQGFALDVALERKPTPKRSADESRLLLQQYRTYYIVGVLLLSLMGAASDS